MSDKLQALVAPLTLALSIFKDNILSLEIKIDDDNLMIGDTAVEVVHDAEDEKFYIGVGYVIHGVRYYSDGSGEPDSYDVVDIADYPDTEGKKTVDTLVTTVATVLADHVAECVMWEEMEKQQAAERELELAEEAFIRGS